MLLRIVRRRLVQSTGVVQGKLTWLQNGTLGIGFIKPLHSDLASRIDAIFDDVTFLKKLSPDMATARKFGRPTFRSDIRQRNPGRHMIVGPKSKISRILVPCGDAR